MLSQLVWKLREEETGQGMVEYGLIIALITLTVVVGVQALGSHPMAFFEDFVTKFTAIVSR